MAGTAAAKNLRYRRVLLKLSGEALAGDKGYGIDLDVIAPIARDIAAAVASGAQICLVVGGGNIFRGLMAAEVGIDRARADYMGMLATVMNALALQAAIEREGRPARVLSAIPMPTVCEAYIRDKALDHLDKGRVVIFAGGTGNPVLHHRHGRRAPRRRDGLRRAAQGDPSRWRLQRRPGNHAKCQALRPAQL